MKVRATSIAVDSPHATLATGWAGVGATLTAKATLVTEVGALLYLNNNLPDI